MRKGRRDVCESRYKDAEDTDIMKEISPWMTETNRNLLGDRSATIQLNSRKFLFCRSHTYYLKLACSDV
mgnify:CR=1 FL=1